MTDLTHNPRLRPIASRHNTLVKELRWCFSHAELSPNSEFAVEGIRTIEEAIRSGLRLRAVFFNETGAAMAERLCAQLGSEVEALLLPDDVFRSAVNTEMPQGVAALVTAKPSTIDALFTAPQPLLVVAGGIQDPGNLGTIIRSAEAFGASGVVVADKTVSPWNAKVIRAAAGSLFRLPVVKSNLSGLLTLMKERGIRSLAAAATKGTPLPLVDFRQASAIFIGNEGSGLPREMVSRMDETISIPQSSKVESLNAGVAAAIILYEAARQRLHLEVSR